MSLTKIHSETAKVFILHIVPETVKNEDAFVFHMMPPLLIGQNPGSSLNCRTAIKTHVSCSNKSCDIAFQQGQILFAEFAFLILHVIGTNGCWDMLRQETCNFLELELRLKAATAGTKKIKLLHILYFHKAI